MPRRKLLIRPYELHVSLPGDVHEKLKRFLTSDRSGSVPQGAYQRFFLERIEEFFRKLEATGNQLLKELENDPRGD